MKMVIGMIIGFGCLMGIVSGKRTGFKAVMAMAGIFMFIGGVQP